MHSTHESARRLLNTKVTEFPKSPGVYLMKGEGGKVIYVGKAKHLKERVKQYFSKEADTRYQIKFLLKRLIDIDYIVCQNEKEALLLENSLIKKYKPRYNIFLKDDKSYVSLKLSINHRYPQLLLTRKIKNDGSIYFGPYASAQALKETVEFLQTSFKLRTCSDHVFANRARPCLEYQIHRCSAPCVNCVSCEEYLKQVEPVRLFLEGKNKELKSQIKKNMEEAARQEKYEWASEWRDLLSKMETTLEKQRVVKHGGQHQDLIYLYCEGSSGVIAVMNIRGGSLLDSHYYPVKIVEDKGTLMSHFLCQYYLGLSFVPDEILVSPLPHDDSVLKKVLTEKKGHQVGIRIPQRGEKKDLLKLAEQNAQSYYRKLVKKEYALKEVLEVLQKKIGLATLPQKIECFDISNIQGQYSTASCVVFRGGEPHKLEYRHYKIDYDKGIDDYAMMREVIGKRYHHVDPHQIPDLIVIDGGKGQLNTVKKVLEEMNLSQIPLMSVAKGKGEGARSKGLWNEKKEEEIYIPNRKNPLMMKRGSPELMLLQRIRDEAHRFAIHYHRKLRTKNMIHTPLDNVTGLGPQKKKALYERFKDMEGIQKASLEELMSVRGITEKMAMAIKK